MAPATIRRAPYKDFLQPALHRRFSTTASILLGIGYLVAILLASWHSYFWSWFPIGPTGIRAFFVSICGLSIIILRIAQYHVGLRTSDSAFQTFSQTILKLQTLEALVSYVFSGWLFSQVYLWSYSKDGSLDWVTYYSGDRARLNERPLFFTCYFIIHGAIQAGIHLTFDYDRLSLGVARPADGGGAQDGKYAVSQFKRFMDEIPGVLITSGALSLVSIGASIVLYPVCLRRSVWRTAMFFFRPFYNLPKTNMVPNALPFNMWLLVQCAFAGALLSVLWLAGNRAFSIFLVREPLKNGKPLTSESKDPNGSLLNGLKSKKLSIQAFALWELAFIARDYDARRKAVYEDIDRKDGPMWSQVYGICLDIVRGMEGRIDNYGKPAPVAPVAGPAVEEKKRSTQPPKQDAIFQVTPQKKNFRTEVEKAVNQVTTSPGQGSQLSPLAKKAMASAKSKLLQIQQEATGSDDPQSLFKSFAMKLLSSPLGWPFRQEISRRLTTVVLGAPYGEPGLYVNAINSLGQLAVHSLTEDKYGNVQRDVATIIRTFTSTTTKLVNFKQQLPFHWTDVDPVRDVPEVDVIVEALRDSLAQLIQEFGPYARDLRLSMTDMRLAKEAAGVVNNGKAAEAPEMRQIR